jgi:hypothetical protein
LITCLVKLQNMHTKASMIFCRGEALFCGWPPCFGAESAVTMVVTVYGEPDASTVPQVCMTQFYREVEATQV